MSVLIIIFFSKQSHSLKEKTQKQKHNRSGSNQKVPLLFGEINCSLHSPLSAGLVIAAVLWPKEEEGLQMKNKKAMQALNYRSPILEYFDFFPPSFQGLKSFK